ncbi:MAG: sugar 3,4-ketoisomerase [Peptostreptococcaceae bacterium]
MKGCYEIEFNSIGNNDIGYLVALEENNQIPFEIKRIYYSHSVPKDVVRGNHAHKKLQQVLICLNGNLKIKCSNGKEEKIYYLNDNNKGLYMGPMTWREIYNYNEYTVLLVIVSEYYDENDYIRDYDEFLKLANKD